MAGASASPGLPKSQPFIQQAVKFKAWDRAQELAMDRLEAGVYQPVTCTLSSILREYLAKVTPIKKSHASEARRFNPLLKDPIASYEFVIYHTRLWQSLETGD